MINERGNIAVAISIVVAGLLIAAAVIFTNGLGGGDSTNPENSTGSDLPSKVNPVDENDWVYGNRDAKIKIVEYSDTECPYCSFLHPTLEKVVADYDGQVAWVYRHFPLVQLHPIAPTVSLASECVGELAGNDGFWGFINKIYGLSYENYSSEEPKNLSAHAENPDLLKQYAGEFGVDEAQFTQCMEETRHQDRVKEDYENAVLAGGQGTPFNIIILDEEVNGEQRASIEATAAKVNRPGQNPNIVLSKDGKNISLAGAMPEEIWKEILDVVLN